MANLPCLLAKDPLSDKNFEAGFLYWSWCLFGILHVALTKTEISAWIAGIQVPKNVRSLPFWRWLLA
jgi:hypothetical protein